MVFLCASKIP